MGGKKSDIKGRGKQAGLWGFCCYCFMRGASMVKSRFYFQYTVRVSRLVQAKSDCCTIYLEKNCPNG